MKRHVNELWQDLIQRHLDGITSDEEVKKLSDKLESCSETRTLYLKLQHLHSTLMNDEFSEPSKTEPEHRILKLISDLEQSNRILKRRRILVTLASIAAAVLVILSSWLLWNSQPERIVEITSIQGAVQWTGDGGNVIEALEHGGLLTGGTIETRSVSSFVELRFRDGSTLSVSGGSVLTLADDGQKKLYLRSGILSADVKKQQEQYPMIVVTPAARLEVLGTRFDVMANPERSKISVRQGLVRAVRMSDGKSVNVAGGHSAIASTEVESDFLPRRADQAVQEWTANLEQDHKQGEGEFVSAMVALRFEIRDALQRGEVLRSQIPEVYGERLATISEMQGVLKAQPKQIRHSQFGNVIQIATLHVNRDQTNPVVLSEQSVFRVQGKVVSPTEIHVGIGAFGTTEASAGRFLTSRKVTGKFDLEIPVEQFRPFRGRGGTTSPEGMEVFHWFCLTSDTNAELEISSVELKIATN